MIALAQALAWIEQSTARLPVELVRVAAAAGRVLAGDLPALAPLPRAAIDGYAVRAADTEGASDYAPLPLAATAVIAGAAMPAGADAVLPLHAIEYGSALAAAAPGDGVDRPDELVLRAGTVLRPAQLAVLALRGLAGVEVVRRPVVRLRVAGPKAGADALTPMLLALIAAEGGTVGGDADLVLHAGRSGPGPDDDGISAFDSVFAHGVLIRPGETSALGLKTGTPALLLPGDPLACATAFALLATPALRRLGGRPEPLPATATLSRKVVSGLGQIDAVPVRVIDGTATPLGPPLSAAAEADGLVLAPEGSEGYPAGASVAIYPLP